jgi:hypothetical protein
MADIIEADADNGNGVPNLTGEMQLETPIIGPLEGGTTQMDEEEPQKANETPVSKAISIEEQTK